MEPVKIDCATKFRFYPTPEQEILLSKTFGCVRFVWNAVLAAREEAWEDFGIAISFPDASALLTDLKNDPDLAFLGEVSSVPFQQALRHQQRAYDNFFSGRVGKPRFKRKDESQSAVFMKNAFDLSGRRKARPRSQEEIRASPEHNLISLSAPTPEGIAGRRQSYPEAAKAFDSELLGSVDPGDLIDLDINPARGILSPNLNNPCRYHLLGRSVRFHHPPPRARNSAAVSA